MTVARERRRASRYHRAVDRFKQRLIRRALMKAEGCIAQAARILGVNRTELYKLIKRFDAELPHDGTPSEVALQSKLLAWQPPAMPVQQRKRRTACRSTRSITRSSSSELPPS